MKNSHPKMRTNQPLGGLANPARYLPAGLISIVVMLGAYWPALHGQLIWDDDLVTKPELRSVTGLVRIWTDPSAAQQYYPLLHSTMWVEYQLFSDHTLGYHAVNLCFHLVACWLLFFVLKKLKIPGAWLATGIFALHPVQVETVAWITEQKNTLSAVFYFGAALAYLRFGESRKTSSYVTALMLFALALLSKTTAVTLPVALLILFWWQRGKLSWQRDVRPLIPFFLLGAVAGLFTAWVEWQVIEAKGNEFALTFIQRGLLASRAIWFYLRSLFWPNNLIFVYPRWEIDPAAWWQWLYVAATVATTLGLWAVRKKWRAPLAGWLFFAVTLFPALGFFNVYLFRFTFVADHFQYLACLGVIVPIAAAAVVFFVRQSTTSRRLGTTLAIALLGVLATLSWRQSRMYDSPEDIFQTTIDRNPSCWVAENNLGNLLFRKLNPNLPSEDAIKIAEGAATHYRRAMELKPDLADVHYNLARVLNQLGRPMEAIQEYKHALDFAPKRVEVHFNLARTLLDIGQPEQAIEHLQWAVEFKPDFADAQYKLAQELGNIGKPREAIEHYRKAIELDNNYAPGHNDLAMELVRIGQTKEAIGEFQRALQLDPNLFESYYNLGLLYGGLNRSADTIALFQKAVDVAKSSNQPAVAEQFQNLLDSYRASLNQR